MMARQIATINVTYIFTPGAIFSLISIAQNENLHVNKNRTIADALHMCNHPFTSSSFKSATVAQMYNTIAET